MEDSGEDIYVDFDEETWAFLRPFYFFSRFLRALQPPPDNVDPALDHATPDKDSFSTEEAPRDDRPAFTSDIFTLTWITFGVVGLIVVLWCLFQRWAKRNGRLAPENDHDDVGAEKQKDQEDLELLGGAMEGLGEPRPSLSARRKNKSRMEI